MIAASPLLTDRLRRAAETAALRVLGDQDTDASSPTYGCFDRRYWAWKIVDFPEATFQRHVYPLAMLVQDPASRLYQRADVLDAVRAGLTFALSVQHRNGSFDQAFPFEQSWGATAFLLQPLLAAFELLKPSLGADADRIADRLSASARFLVRQREQHGTIANHLAGGAHALIEAGRVLSDGRSTAAGKALVGEVIALQTDEGWFPEYGGADPGYQTLCLYYLAEVAQAAPSPELTRALGRALDFLQWFVHPDGTLGGVYGSRRTRVAYPGGLALLSKEFPVAAAAAQAVLTAAAEEKTVTVLTIDAANLAPLLTNIVRALPVAPAPSAAQLPRDRESASADFPKAGLHVRATPAYYAIVGSANGGTLTVFDRSTGARIKDDGGYVAQLEDGRFITSQVTGAHAVTAAPSSIAVQTRFREMRREAPRPWQFLLLRVLNLTVMRSLVAGNAIKRAIVSRLIAAQAPVPLDVTRTFTFGDRIAIVDRFSNDGGLTLRWLRGGRPFQSVHMASAGYDGATFLAGPEGGVEIDAAQLTRSRAAEWSGRV